MNTKPETNDLPGDDVTVGPLALPTAYSPFPNTEYVMTAFEHYLSLIARDNPSLHSKITSD